MTRFSVFGVENRKSIAEKLIYKVLRKNELMKTSKSSKTKYRFSQEF